MNSTQIPTIVYDVFAVSHFCRSVALSVSLQQLTQLHYKEISSSNLVTALYMAWYGEGPSTEIHQASKQRIQNTTDEFHKKFLLGWVNKLAQGGPTAGNQYISDLRRQRDTARQAYETLCQDAAKINRQLAQNAEDLKNSAALVKLGATVGVAVIPVIAAAPAFALTKSGLGLVTGINLGYSVTASMISNWEQGPGAKAAGISFELTKAATSEGSGRAAEVLAKSYTVAADSLQAAIAQSKATTASLSQQLGQKGLTQVSRARIVQDMNSTMQATGRMQNAAHAARTSAAHTGVVKKAIPIVFAAIDIWAAFKDYKKDTGS